MHTFPARGEGTDKPHGPFFQPQGREANSPLASGRNPVPATISSPAPLRPEVHPAGKRMCDCPPPCDLAMRLLGPPAAPLPLGQAGALSEHRNTFRPELAPVRTGREGHFQKASQRQRLGGAPSTTRPGASEPLHGAEGATPRPAFAKETTVRPAPGNRISTGKNQADHGQGATQREPKAARPRRCTRPASSKPGQKSPASSRRPSGGALGWGGG